ncbi:MAG: hypothetical protein R3B90_12515 [Planctomycetaceae bacterium]
MCGRSSVPAGRLCSGTSRSPFDRHAEPLQCRRVYDYGLDQDGPFLILEFVDGLTLDEKLKVGPLDPEQAVDLACQLCDGLAKAHERESSTATSNRRTSCALTADGGPEADRLRRQPGKPADDGHTKANTALRHARLHGPRATPRRPLSVDHTAATCGPTGATLYQMFTGQKPRVIRLDDVPAGFRDLLAQTLAEDPVARPASARDLRDALRQARAPRPHHHRVHRGPLPTAPAGVRGRQ